MQNVPHVTALTGFAINSPPPPSPDPRPAKERREHDRTRPDTQQICHAEHKQIASERKQRPQSIPSKVDQTYIQARPDSTHDAVAQEQQDKLGTQRHARPGIQARIGQADHRKDAQAPQDRHAAAMEYQKTYVNRPSTVIYNNMFPPVRGRPSEQIAVNAPRRNPRLPQSYNHCQ